MGYKFLLELARCDDQYLLLVQRKCGGSNWYNTLAIVAIPQGEPPMGRYDRLVIADEAALEAWLTRMYLPLADDLETAKGAARDVMTIIVESGIQQALAEHDEDVEVEE